MVRFSLAFFYFIQTTKNFPSTTKPCLGRFNPKQFSGGGEFTVKLPVSCPVPCDKGHTHGCSLGAQLLNCYRNTTQIRELLRFQQDHQGAPGKRLPDKGANLQAVPQVCYWKGRRQHQEDQRRDSYFLQKN